MVFHMQPRPVVAMDGVSWTTVGRDNVVEVQKYQLGGVGRAIAAVAAVALHQTGTQMKEFRLVTRGEPQQELAAADSLQEIQRDAEAARRGSPGDAAGGAQGAVPVAVRQALGANGGAAPQEETAVSQWSAPEVRGQLEPWAVTLLDRADQLRYVCHALKIASSIGADFSTFGLGGEEVVGLAFAAIDAALVSSWMHWFMTSLLDDSPGSNVVRQVMALEFTNGPQAIVTQADQICATMRPQDKDQVQRLAMTLKRRISVVVGDIISVLVPNDCGLSGALITELLIRLKPVDADDALNRLIGWYGLMNTDNRRVLEDSDQLLSLLRSSNGAVKQTVVQEFDKPLGEKAIGVAKRSAGLMAANIALALTPVGPVVAAMQVANVAGSVAVCSNTGRASAGEVFETMEGKMPVVVETLHRSLAASFAVLVLLARCA